MIRYVPRTIRTDRSPHARPGFTLIELLVVFSIIAVLASLIAPAIQSARRSARRMECLNNMRNVGIGIHNFATMTGGTLPALSTSMEIPNAAGQGIMSVGWPISILPFVDNAALLKNIEKNAVIASGTATLASSENIWLPVFTCPDSNDAYRRPGGLSYVVNAGFISAEVWGAQETATFFHQPYLINWKADTIPAYRSTDGTTATGNPSVIDMQTALATGVFWRIVGDITYQPSVDYVANGDGTTTTIMVTENLNAGPWSDTSVNSIGFGIRIPVDVITAAPAYGTTSPCGEFPSALVLNSQFPCSTFIEASAGSFINQSVPVGSTLVATTSTTTASNNMSNGYCGSSGTTPTTVTTTSSPRPSSQHAGGVNVIMVDGSGRFLSETIDPNVYARLVTSSGVVSGELTLDEGAY